MPTLDPHHAVYAGSFDPVTLGHLDIVRRGANVFDRLTVGIGINPDKRPLFSPDERQSLMQRVFDGLDNVEVRCFEGLTVDFVRECGAGVMLRGIRTLTDIESEFTMALANRALSTDVETVFLMAGEGFSHISSTLIKQIAQMGGEQTRRKLSEFVPEPVIEPLIEKLSRQ
ncbi:MAG: pantetheine-phosphate adenylyltransferase [Maioricimonas sp. JB045]|uniref:pantetheine-phosphate adenylyltransferase n=1 Tax=Maioricimonas sp. JC845 TaxID=3232138 RepID=UPI00345865B2